MPRARKTGTPATAGEPGGSSSDVQADGGAAATVDSANENSSEEVMVIASAQDEPVRMGGYILTDDGWVLEDGPVPDDDVDQGEPAPETEQE